MKPKEFEPNQPVAPKCEKNPLFCHVSPHINEREIPGVPLRGKHCGCIKKEEDIEESSRAWKIRVQLARARIWASQQRYLSNLHRLGIDLEEEPEEKIRF